MTESRRTLRRRPSKKILAAFKADVDAHDDGEYQCFVVTKYRGRFGIHYAGEPETHKGKMVGNLADLLES